MFLGSSKCLRSYQLKYLDYNYWKSNVNFTPTQTLPLFSVRSRNYYGEVGQGGGQGGGGPAIGMMVMKRKTSFGSLFSPRRIHEK